MTTLSFVVVAFNNTKRLRTCLSSLADQDYPDVEIVVCDNSTDESVASDNDFLCSQLSTRIRYEYTADKTIITGPHTRCLYTATEIGVGLAKGDWIAMPNQDTAYPPVFAERMISHAESNNFDLVYCDFLLGGPSMDYRLISVQPRNCQIDKTCFIVRKSWFAGFPDKTTNYSCADGLMIESLVARGIRHGAFRQCLVTHN